MDMTTEFDTVKSPKLVSRQNLLLLSALAVAATPAVTPAAIIGLTGTPPLVDGSQLTAPANTATFTPGSATSTAITVTKIGPSSYIPGYAHVVAATGSAVAFAQINGFTPATDQEVYALHLLVGGVSPTQNQLGQIIQDINSQTGTNIVATTIPASYTSVFYASVGYKILLTANPGVGTSAYLGFDFRQETNVAGVSVADIGAVPEPASLAALLVTAAGLTIGRRRSVVPTIK